MKKSLQEVPGSPESALKESGFYFPSPSCGGSPAQPGQPNRLGASVQGNVLCVTTDRPQGLPAEPPNQLSGLGRKQGRRVRQWLSLLREKAPGLAFADAGGCALLSSSQDRCLLGEVDSVSLSRTVTSHTASTTRRTPASDWIAGRTETHPCHQAQRGSPEALGSVPSLPEQDRSSPSPMAWREIWRNKGMFLQKAFDVFTVCSSCTLHFKEGARNTVPFL